MRESIMLGNYLKVAYRNLVRSKLYTLISTVGLAIGIACCILVFLYVQSEFSYDKFHANANDIYRLIQVRTSPDGTVGKEPSTSGLLGPLLESDFPEAVRSARLASGQKVVWVKNKSFSQTLHFVDPGFLEMFSFPLLTGGSRNVLSDPYSVVITAETARKYFGDADPVGQQMTIQLDETEAEFTVAGLVQSPPDNSSIDFDFLIPFEQTKNIYPEGVMENWDNSSPYTFVQLKPGTGVAAFSDRLNRNVARLTEGIKLSKDDKLSHQLQPLTDIHLNPAYEGVDEPASDPMYSFILCAIALAILLIACINFTTLTVGRAAGRIREVGVRKAVGADRRELMKQFWTESLLISLAAVLLAVVLSELMLPVFCDLSGKKLTLDLWSNWILIPALSLLVILSGAIAGAYPALYQSRFPAAVSLKRSPVVSSKTGLVRALVALQFVFSVFLIIATLTMSKQMSFITGRDLGYDRQWVVTIPVDAPGEKAATVLERFRGQLSGRPEILNISGYSYPLGSYWLRFYTGESQEVCVNFGENINQSPGNGESDTQPFYYTNFVDYDYLSTLNIDIIEGRNFSREYPSDATGSVLVNRAAVKAFGWEDAVGRQLPFGFKERKVIGVIDDFHFYPVHRQIEPLVLSFSGTGWLTSIGEIAVKIDSRDVTGTMTLLEETWKETSEGLPFSYTFLDDQVAKQYATEKRWERIVGYASLLSLLVACLGLFGVASLAVARREKEIGIRKVVGATVSHITILFLKEFALLVVLASLIASPVAYLVMNRWLENFAYRTDMGAFVFILATAVALAIAMITVIYQVIGAALANPVESLKYE
jgi:putative ABC transport system permease protein